MNKETFPAVILGAVLLSVGTAADAAVFVGNPFAHQQVFIPQHRQVFVPQQHVFFQHPAFFVHSPAFTNRFAPTPFFNQPAHFFNQPMNPFFFNQPVNRFNQFQFSQPANFMNQPPFFNQPMNRFVPNNFGFGAMQSSFPFGMSMF